VRPTAFGWGVLLGTGAGVLLGALMFWLLGAFDDGDGTDPADDGSSIEATETSTRSPSDGAASPSPSPVEPGPITADDGSTVAADRPTDLPVRCPEPTVRVSTEAELQAALDAAEPGDSIQLADGIYVGNFEATRAGTRAQPISLCGGPGAVLTGGGIKEGYVVYLLGTSEWRLVGFTVREGQKGVMLDATTRSVVQGLTVEEIGDEGIHLRSASSNNVVLGNTVRRTGLRRDEFGEGIYVGSATSNWDRYSEGDPDRSDQNLVQGNDIRQTGSESIDVKEGTTGGTLVANVMDGEGMTGADSLVDVKGNGWVIDGNTGTHGPEDGFQTHRILDGWGTGNVFRGNTVDVDGGGFHFYVHDPEDTDNTVACDNRTGDGGRPRSNVPCR
jgi:parallel beta-helix repeat protein